MYLQSNLEREKEVWSKLITGSYENRSKKALKNIKPGKETEWTLQGMVNYKTHSNGR